MIAADTSWQAEFEAWPAPFLARLRRKEQRRWAPVYLQGLLGPGERKSVEPMAARVAPGDVQQLHHFVAASPWATAPLEEELVRQADRLVGGPDAVLVIDDTALVKQGRHSVGVARQYCGELGKQAGQVPGPGVADPGPRRGAGRRRPAPVPAGALGRGSGAAGQGGRTGGHPRPAQVADRAGRAGPGPRGRGNLRRRGGRR